jgi:hypothetical protein
VHVFTPRPPSSFSSGHHLEHVADLQAPRRGRRQAKRTSLVDKLTVEAKALADLKIEKAAVEGERRAVEADLGPAANPQAQAMHVNSNTMHTVQAAAMVGMCLAAGYIIAFGAGLVWPRG